MRDLLPFLLLFSNTLFAQTDSIRQQAKSPAALLRSLDRATVWEGVRIKTEAVFGGKNVEPSFKIKRDKEKRRELIAALEAQFQVNIAESDIRSLKRADDLTDYIFEAQGGIVLFSKANFQGKAERVASERKDCKQNFDCLNFIGSAIVPKGLKVTLFSQPKFEGEQLVIDASKEEVRVPSFFNIVFSGAVSATSKAVNWREEVRSIRVTGYKSKSLSDD